MEKCFACESQNLKLTNMLELDDSIGIPLGPMIMEQLEKQKVIICLTCFSYAELAPEDESLEK